VKPRWLGLLAIVLLVIATFGMLGLWQLNVARDKGRVEQIRVAPTRPSADLAAVLSPHSAFPGDGTGRRITVAGRYDGSGQVLVAPRRLRGVAGYWVVTPLVVRSSGARIAVVRGFVTDPRQALAPSAAEITVSGTLAPGESPSADGPVAAASMPKGQMATLDLSFLVNRWPGALYNAFVFAGAEQPDVTSAASPAVQRVPAPPLTGGGLSWRNAAYAFQWWIFALFAAYMWWKMVRDDYQDSHGSQDRGANSPDDTPDDNPDNNGPHERAEHGALAPAGEIGKASNV
jgi:surfeit locus 1 family protein